MNEALSKVKHINNSGAVIYLPARLVTDDKFPFKRDNNIVIIIKGRHLIIEPVDFTPANEL